MQLLDTKDVATMLQCSPSGVRKLRSAGRLPTPVRIGRLLRWNGDEIESWIAAGAPPAEKWEVLKGRKGAK